MFGIDDIALGLGIGALTGLGTGAFTGGLKGLMKGKPLQGALSGAAEGALTGGITGGIAPAAAPVLANQLNPVTNAVGETAKEATGFGNVLNRMMPLVKGGVSAALSGGGGAPQGSTPASFGPVPYVQPSRKDYFGMSGLMKKNNDDEVDEYGYPLY